MRKWTTEEDNRLLRQIEAFPQNLSRCFIIVADEIGRTPTACAARWYTYLSKRPDVTLYATISKHNLSRNRKNSQGVEISTSIWSRFMTLIRNLIV